MLPIMWQMKSSRENNQNWLTDERPRLRQLFLWQVPRFLFLIVGLKALRQKLTSPSSSVMKQGDSSRILISQNVEREKKNFPVRFIWNNAAHFLTGLFVESIAIFQKNTLLHLFWWEICLSNFRPGERVETTKKTLLLNLKFRFPRNKKLCGWIRSWKQEIRGKISRFWISYFVSPPRLV